MVISKSPLGEAPAAVGVSTRVRQRGARRSAHLRVPFCMVYCVYSIWCMIYGRVHCVCVYNDRAACSQTHDYVGEQILVPDMPDSKHSRI